MQNNSFEHKRGAGRRMNVFSAFHFCDARMLGDYVNS